MPKNMPWFRVYVDFLNDPKMIALAFEDQRHFIGVLALKSDGTIDQDCDEELLNRIVSQRLWLDYSTIKEVKKRLIDAGLITNNWQPIAWDKRQYKSDKDSTAGERQRRYRESKNKQINNNELSDCDSNALRNTTVTRLDTDTDTEKEPIDTNVSIVGNEIPDCPHQEIINLYTKHLPMAIQPTEWDNGRASLLRTRWREKKKRQSLSWWDKFFEYISKSDFLTGKVNSKDRRPFEISLPWILKSNNFMKIIDGTYENK